MWEKDWRDILWSEISHQEWDMVVVGGGITGAGILREAARRNLKVLLVEQRDFAWGTSSRSSKLVHGGLRYLAQGQLGLTWASVREREQLLKEAPGLVESLGFLIATHKGDRPGKWTYSAGLSLYDLMALQWSHQYFSPEQFKMLAPHLSTEKLSGGFRYEDAQTDDARLTLRVIREAVADGGFAMNYVQAEELIWQKTNDEYRVQGVVLRNVQTKSSCGVYAKVVVNATGAWANQLHQRQEGETTIRPLRGSHLIFPQWRLPAAQAITFLHPFDRRPVFLYPWEGVTIIGTTDIDHPEDLKREPRISPEEVAYLMAAVNARFPSRNITLDDVIATFAGVRPVIGTGKADPSKESRDYVLWKEKGLITVTGGKLTTFRMTALDVLQQIQEFLPPMPEADSLLKEPVLNDLKEPFHDSRLDDATCRRLAGRYGQEVHAFMAEASDEELTFIPGTPYLWAELRWAARMEGVVQLDDLLLRRVRLGLLLPNGGEKLFPQIQTICQAELAWDDDRWQHKLEGYRILWNRYYSLPERSLIPDWQVRLQQLRQHIDTDIRKSYRFPILMTGLLLFWLWRWLRRKVKA